LKYGSRGEVRIGLERDMRDKKIRYENSRGRGVGKRRGKERACSITTCISTSVMFINFTFVHMTVFLSLL
jgi:hypothetical protein